MAKKQQNGNLLGTAGSIIGGLSTIGGWLGIGEGRQDRRQINQQTKLNEVNAKTAKEMADHEQALKLKMWKDTNYGGMLAEAEKAGVSKAAAIGGSGTGTQGASVGSVGGGNAADAASTTNARTAQAQAGMQLASQLALMKAQKENIEADTANKTAGAGGIIAGTAKTGEETKALEFQNKINKLVGEEASAEAVRGAQAKIEAEGGKAWQEYQAWKAAGFGEKAIDDPTSPVAKAIGAGMSKAVEEMKNAKASGDVSRAEAIIRKFEADMAGQGLSPKSPWYIKFVADLLGNIGLNPLKK
ncbi:MAG: hypothetical protein [Wigfec virus K19_81]|nr:MAG: hypothetical protein [Wigfec virus K19_81]